MADFDNFRHLQERARRQPPRVALVLGSGLGELTARVHCLERVSYSEVPGLERPGVAGHLGVLTLGTWAGQDVLVFSGRIHFYEGHTWDKVVQPVHIARDLGARILVLTNAAGGIRDDLTPGSLLAVNAHLDWTLLKKDEGERKKDEQHDSDSSFILSPSSFMNAGLVSQLQSAAQELDISLPTGRYAQVTGPCYETPAEIRALKSLGVDAVGMSTVREAQTGSQLGLACAAISCITNRAAGLGQGRIDHEEVLACTSRSTRRLADLLERFLERLA